MAFNVTHACDPPELGDTQTFAFDPPDVLS